MTHKNQDKDKDLNLVLKESLRTRTRINIAEICIVKSNAVTHIYVC